jgi:hypothetical protein
MSHVYRERKKNLVQLNPVVRLLLLLAGKKKKINCVF